MFKSIYLFNYSFLKTPWKFFSNLLVIYRNHFEFGASELRAKAWLRNKHFYVAGNRRPVKRERSKKISPLLNKKDRQWPVFFIGMNIIIYLLPHGCKLPTGLRKIPRVFWEKFELSLCCIFQNICSEILQMSVGHTCPTPLNYS